MVMFDYMHVYLVGGLMSWEVWSLMQYLKPYHVTWSSVHTYFHRWSWPRGGVSAHDVFSNTRNGRNEKTPTT